VTPAQAIVVDGHLDLASNALSTGRDLTLPVAAIRASDAGGAGLGLTFVPMTIGAMASAALGVAVLSAVALGAVDTVAPDPAALVGGLRTASVVSACFPLAAAAIAATRLPKHEPRPGLADQAAATA
jgi:hypothetical protein